jgi:protein-S-isoprenylcysteine O-methyltransferase Ste14
MSLGYNLVGGAVVLLMASPAMIMLSYPLLLIWQGRFLRQEEKILARRFRQDYPTYQAKTPFLIPLPPLSRR